MNKHQKLSAQIIDTIEERLRKIYPKIDKIASKDASFLKVLSDLIKNKERVLSDAPLKIIKLLMESSLKDTPVLELDKVIMNGCRTVLVDITQDTSS